MSRRILRDGSQSRPRRRLVALAFTGLAALTVMLFAIPHAGAAFKYLKTGMEVPEFSLKTLAGEEYTVEKVKGQPATLLVFWATWSPRSVPALEEAQKLYTQYAEKGFKVIAVNVDKIALGLNDRRAIEEMTTKLALTIPVVIDEGLQTYNTFGVVATPSTAVLDTEGKIIHEAASFLSSTGVDIREAVEILLGVREAPAADAVAAKPVYKPERKALLNYNLGRNLLRLGSKEKAITKFEEAVAADLKYAAPRILLGHLLLGRKDPENSKKAADLFKEATVLDPDNVSAHTGYGEALLEMGKNDEAAASFEKAVALDPSYTPAVSNLALTLAKQGKAQEAEARFKAALELNPVDPGTFQRRGESLEAGGNLKGAAADYRRAVEILMNLPSTGDRV